MFVSNSIIITDSENKREILKSCSNKLNNIKIYTLSEFKKLYFFSYDKETIYYISKKYHVNCEIALTYLENLYFIQKEEYQNKKLNFLIELKQDLLNNNLIKKSKMFLSTLKKRTIYFYNIPLTKEIESIIKSLKTDNDVQIKSRELHNYQHIVYKFKDIEDEIIFIANRICSYVKEGHNLSNIYLINLNDDYKKLIKRFFPMFNIPFTLKEDISLYKTSISVDFLANYGQSLDKTIDYLREKYQQPEEKEIIDMIIDIVNEYTFIDDKLEVKELIEYDLKHTNIPSIDNKNSVHEASINTLFKESDYVFLPSFNQTIFPTIYKDEDYLTDLDKQELNMSLTIDKNNLEKAMSIEILSNIKNLIISYKESANNEEYSISNLNEELKYEIKEEPDLFIFSDLYNKIKLATLLDEYNKYGTTSEMLYTLNNHYQELPYKNYNHTFKGINKEAFKKYLNDTLKLSYTSLDKYYRCPFSYYVSYILKLNIYEETFSQIIGTLFHSVLENWQSKEDFEILWHQGLAKLEHEFTPKESFFLKKLKEELKFVLKTITEQENFTKLKDELHELKIYTDIPSKMKATFSGIIDKIKYLETENNTILAIIDYKTGTPNLDLTTIEYGIGMQLPIYLYLIKNSNHFKNPKIAGFYLQKILNNEIAVDNTHSYEQLKKKNLLLQGYSNEDMEVLSLFDTSYLDSNLIKGMKVTNNNSFYHYTKVLNDKEIDFITELATKKINEGAKKIIECDFSISPKKMGKVNYGCDLCPFRDLCFHNYDDVIELQPLKLEDLIGGEENGLD